jgi:hypothetical protein
MRKVLVAACACIIVAFAPVPALAWGFAGHRFIMQHAIEVLPPALKPFFVEHRDEIVLRVTDPDLWRNVGWEDDPNHFLDFGVPEYGPYPFTALPREYGAAVEKFGAPALKRNGLLPWREAEMFGNLRRTFDGFKRRSPYSVSDLVLFSAVASHYIQDACQPFHATTNYDGQLTGQRGIHARFERDLIERYQNRLAVSPAPPAAITNARDAAFDALLSGYQLVDAVLKADKEASAGRESYDDPYFEAFFAKVKPLLERRLSEAVNATVGLIVGAWEQAGKPPVRLQDVRPIERVVPPK